MMTNGMPGSVAPATDSPGASTEARYQTAGARSFRCGSLASIGWPVALRAPETTNELLPMPSPPSRPSGSRSANVAARDRHRP